jgi:hypothetical protein
MSTIEELSKRARFLRNAAPQPFADFYAAFVDYTDRQYEVMVLTTAEALQNAQGHAQQCKKILDVLTGVKNG